MTLVGKSKTRFSETLGSFRDDDYCESTTLVFYWLEAPRAAFPAKATVSHHSCREGDRSSACEHTRCWKHLKTASEVDKLGF